MCVEGLLKNRVALCLLTALKQAKLQANTQQNVDKMQQNRSQACCLMFAVIAVPKEGRSVRNRRRVKNSSKNLLLIFAFPDATHAGNKTIVPGVVQGSYYYYSAHARGQLLQAKDLNLPQLNHANHTTQ